MGIFPNFLLGTELRETRKSAYLYALYGLKRIHQRSLPVPQVFFGGGINFRIDVLIGFRIVLVVTDLCREIEFCREIGSGSSSSRPFSAEDQLQDDTYYDHSAKRDRRQYLAHYDLFMWMYRPQDHPHHGHCHHLGLPHFHLHL